MTLRKLPWPLFQPGGQSVVPAVEKAEQRENRDHLQYLVVVEVTAQFRELSIPNGIRHVASGLRKAQGRAFGFTELGALLELR